MNLKNVDLDELKDHPGNPNKHPQNQIEELINSLDRFDQVRNVVVWQGFILAGHGLVMAARNAGRQSLQAVDVSEWDEEKAVSFMLADNQLTNMSFIDDEIMLETLRMINEPLDIPGFDEDFLAGLGAIEVDNPHDEWKGMPEFKQEDSFGAILSIKVHFATEEDIENFAALIDQTVTTSTKFLWYPKQERMKLKELGYINEP